MIYNESTDRFNPDTMKEEHYTLTWEPEGGYLHHSTPEKPTGEENPAFKISQHIYNWLNDDGADVALWIHGWLVETPPIPTQGAGKAW